MPNFITDLNKRERDRYSEMLHQISIGARKAAETITAENDLEALPHLIGLALFQRPLLELIDVFKNGVEADVPHDISSITSKIPEE